MSQVDRGHYFRKKYDDLGRFISYFYQVDLALDAIEADPNNPNAPELPELKKQKFGTFGSNSDSSGRVKILEIGKGSGFFSDYMKKLGYDITTADFDKNLQPDIVADVRSLPLTDNSFDVVTAFEILEHIPFEDVPKALAELQRVSKNRVIISLPYRSTGFEWVFKFPGIRTLLKTPVLSLFLRIPLRFGGIKISGQHYWEIDAWSYRLSRVRRLLSQYFTLLKEVRPPLNHYHYFFVLEKKL